MSNPFSSGPVAPEYLKYLSHRQEHIQEARHDPNAFAEYCFRDRAGNALVQAPLHRQWQSAMDQHNRLMLFAPRNHGKTVQFCQVRPLFELGNNQELCIKIVGSNDQQAIKRVKVLRNHMERNRDLHRVFPALKHHVKSGGRRLAKIPESAGDWNLGSLTLTTRKGWWLNDPSIQAKSVMSSISGDRADIIFWDDAADRRNSVELPKMRQRIVEGVDDFINTLHPDKSRAWAIGTAWHQSDLNHHFMKIWPTAWYEVTLKHLSDGGIRFGSYIKDASGFERHRKDTLWSLWNHDRLMARLQEIGMRKFLRGFSNRPMTDEEVHIDPDWIEYYDVDPAPNWRIILSIDCASTQGQKSDWTGFVFLAVHPDCYAGKMPPTHKGAIKAFAAYHRRVTAPERVRIIERTYSNMSQLGHLVDGIAIENRGGGQETMEYLLEHKVVPARKIIPVRPVGRKLDRLDRISHYVENGTVQFNPDMDPGLGGAAISEDEGNVVSEITTVPLAEYDDLADAFSQGVWVCLYKYTGLRELAAAAVDDLDEDDPGRPRIVEESGSRMWVI